MCVLDGKKLKVGIIGHLFQLETENEIFIALDDHGGSKASQGTVSVIGTIMRYSLYEVFFVSSISFLFGKSSQRRIKITYLTIEETQT